MNGNKINSVEHLYYELALVLNKNYYDDSLIPYNIFKLVEDEILRKVKYENDNKNSNLHI